MAAGGALSLSSTAPLAKALAEEGKALLPPRGKPQKLFHKHQRPLLVVVEGNDVEKMLKKGIEALGGVEKLVKGKKVVLKANLVTAEAPPMTTSADFLLSLGKLLMEGGGSHITINDASTMRPEEGEPKFKTLKINPAAREAGFDTVNTVIMAPEEYVAVTSEKWRRNKSVDVNKLVYEADVVVNCPMIKRATSVQLSCALKNHFGSVAGPTRWKAHEEGLKGGEGMTFFMEAIAELAHAVNCELTVVDGRTMLTKAGPMFNPGLSEIVTGNKIIFGEDIVAVDAYCAKLLQEKDDTFSAELVGPTFAYAEELGLGTSDLKKVTIKEVSA
jgi:uncharacterized protein (DUF362 family)